MSWSSGNTPVSGAEGLRFKPRAGQIGHSVANGSTLVTAATFLRKELCCLGAVTWKWVPQTRYMLWCITTSIMRFDLIKGETLTYILKIQAIILAIKSILLKVVPAKQLIVSFEENNNLLFYCFFVWNIGRRDNIAFFCFDTLK